MSMTKNEIASALLTAPSSTQGATVQVTPEQARHLKDSGLIGANGGLTRKGSAARQRAMNAALDAAFS